MTDPNCPECGGEETVEYAIGVDDSFTGDCDMCNAGGSDIDEDAEYERGRDAEIDRQEAIQEARD